MRKGVVAGLCLALVVMCLYLPQPCEAQYDALIASILGKFTGMWHNNLVDFMGHTCQFRHRPKFMKYKLYKKGKFRCPGWAPFEGRSRTKNSSMLAREAIKDFMRKGLRTGLISQQDVSLWLNE